MRSCGTGRAWCATEPIFWKIWDSAAGERPCAHQSQLPLDEDERRLYAALGKEARHIDELAEEAGLTAGAPSRSVADDGTEGPGTEPRRAVLRSQIEPPDMSSVALRPESPTSLTWRDGVSKVPPRSRRPHRRARMCHVPVLPTPASHGDPRASMPESPSAKPRRAAAKPSNSSAKTKSKAKCCARSGSRPARHRRVARQSAGPSASIWAAATP